MKIKKLMSSLLAFAMIGSLCACKESKNESDQSGILNSEQAEEVKEVQNEKDGKEVVKETENKFSIGLSSNISDIKLKDIPEYYQTVITDVNGLVEMVAGKEYDKINEDKKDMFPGIVEMATYESADVVMDKLCISFADINEDEIFEMIIARKLSDEEISAMVDEPYYQSGYEILNIFTVRDSKAVCLEKSSSRSRCFINSDKLIIDSGSSGYNKVGIKVFSMEPDSGELVEKYNLYTDNVDEGKTDEIGLYESVDGGLEKILIKEDGSEINEGKIFDKYSEKESEYTKESLKLDYVSIKAILE